VGQAMFGIITKMYLVKLSTHFYVEMQGKFGKSRSERNYTYKKKYNDFGSFTLR